MAPDAEFFDLYTTPDKYYLTDLNMETQRLSPVEQDALELITFATALGMDGLQGLPDDLINCDFALSGFLIDRINGDMTSSALNCMPYGKLTPPGFEELAIPTVVTPNGLVRVDVGTSDTEEPVVHIPRIEFKPDSFQVQIPF